MNLQNLLLVFAGGGFGAACRFLVTALVTDRLGSAFPYGTLTVNVIGSYIIGLVTFYFSFVHNTAVPEHFRLLCVVGFLGGFTTFSSFSFDTLILAQNHSLSTAGINMLANLLLSAVAVTLGFLTAKAMG